MAISRKKTTRVIFLCNFKHFGYESLDSLVSSKVKPLLLSYVHSEDKYPLKKYEGSDCVLLSAKQLISGKFPTVLYKNGYSPIPVDSDVLQALCACERLFVPMMERQNYFHLSSIKIIQYFHKYLSTWNGIFDALKPDAIVFHNTPHEGFNFVAYSLAKVYGIRTIMPERTLIKDRMFILNDMYQFPKYDKTYTSDEDLDNEFLVDIQKFTKKNSSLPKSNNIFQRISKVGKLFDEVHDPVFCLSKPMVYRWQVEFYTIISKYKIHKMKKWCTENSVSANFDSKYIYYPLQVQPERTTLPMGGIYWNSTSVLSMLISSLPEGWKIYIKEHPRQFTRSVFDANLTRDIDFYKDLLDSDKVELIDTGESSVELSKHSQCVATVTGTVGWEAISSGVPSIVFGYPWYYECPEVYKVGTLKNLRKYLNEINVNSRVVNLSNVRNYASWVTNCSGYVGSLSPANITSLSQAENSYRISNAILENL